MSYDRASPEADSKLVERLYKLGHHSPFEFSSWFAEFMKTKELYRYLVEFCVESRGWELTWDNGTFYLSGNGRTLLDARGTAIGKELYSMAPPEWKRFLEGDGWNWGRLDMPFEDLDMSAPGVRLLWDDRAPAGFDWVHNRMTFFIGGITRVATAQLTRHRTLSFLQQSFRYTSPTEDEFLHPPTLIESDLVREAQDLVSTSHGLYRKLVSEGVPKEDARFYLPLGTTTRIIVGGSQRWLEHFVKVRSNLHAQWEIRQIAGEIEKILTERRKPYNL